MSNIFSPSYKLPSAKLKVVKKYTPPGPKGPVFSPAPAASLPPAPEGYYYGNDGNVYPTTGVPKNAGVAPNTAPIKPLTHEEITTAAAMHSLGVGPKPQTFKDTMNDPSVRGSAADTALQIASQPGVKLTANQGVQTGVKILGDTAILAGAFAIPGVGWPLGVAATYKMYGSSAFGDPTTLKGALQDLSYLPFYRGPRSMVRFVKALGRGETTAKALQAAGASYKESGPLAAAFHHKIQTGSFTKAGLAWDKAGSYGPDVPKAPGSGLPKPYKVSTEAYNEYRAAQHGLDRAGTEELIKQVDAAGGPNEWAAARKTASAPGEALPNQAVHVPDQAVIPPRAAHEIQPLLDQRAGSNLSGLPGEVSVPGVGKLSFHSNADLQGIAKEFEQNPIPTDYVHVDPARAERIAKWYDEAIHSPMDPAVTEAYDAFARETMAQYEALKAKGYTFEFYPDGHDPYPNGPREAVLDATLNKHLYVYPTEVGFGDGASIEHPLLGDSGVKWNGKTVTHNDLFRGVHDLFGHVKEGVGFRADGEENAWRQHSAMYSPLARKAMTSETRGQNSWVNYGPHGEKNKTAQQAETVYADQKAVLAPDWVVNEGASQEQGLNDRLPHEPPRPETQTNLPEVAPGYVRLYRGEHGGNNPGGRWFTPSLDYASSYARGKFFSTAGAKVSYIDVPEEVAKQYLKGTLKHPPNSVDVFHPDAGSEFLLPKAMASRAKDVSDPKQSLMSKLADETGSLDLNKLKSDIATRPTRRSKYGDLTVQFPLSQSIITGDAQRALDRAGERLVPLVNELRASDSATKRLAGKALTPASARGKVPKMAGKRKRDIVKREEAALAHHAKTIHDSGRSILPAIKNDGTQFAHWWYAQLPADLRNPEGLKLARGKIADNLEYAKSGDMLHDLEADIDAAKEAQDLARKAGDTAEVFAHMRIIGQLIAAKRDIPRLMRDLELNVSKFDKVINNPVEADHALLTAMAALTKDTENTYLDAGKLKPEQAANRTGIVSKWVGVEPTGEEFYVGHRMGKIPGGGTSFPGAGLGRVKTPSSLTRMNTMKLVGAGRARHDLGHIVEDWQASQTYKFANEARKEIGKMGEPFEGVVPRGHELVNPKGHRVDRKWKEDVKAQAEAEGFDPKDVNAQDLLDYMNNIMASSPAEQKLMIERAVEGGYSEHLRVVPTDVIDKYIGQFSNARALGAAAGRTHAGKLAGKGFNAFNNFVATSLIYANPGYIPANTAQNLIMAGMHQGAFLPFNLSRAGQIMARAPQKLRNQIIAEVGESASVSAASGNAGITRAFAGHVQTIADNPSRISAFVHEMARLDVIPKAKFTLSEKDFQAIDDFINNPANREKLNDAKDRAVQSQVDFERLGPNERALTKKLMFVWGWMRGASRYPGRFALDHPLRTAGAAYAFAGAPGAPQGVQDTVSKFMPTVAQGMPPYLEGALEAGTQTINGIVYPSVWPTRAISPVSTLTEVGSSIINKPGSQSVGQMVNPGLTAAWDVAHHQSPYGRKEGYKQSATDALTRLMPDVGLTQDLIHPPKAGTSMFPGDSSRLGRLERASRVFPVAVDPERAFRAKVLAGEIDTYHSAVHTLVRDSIQSGMGEPPQSVLEDLKWYTDLSHEIRRDVDQSGRIDYLKAAKSTAKLYDKRYGGTTSSEQVAGLSTQEEGKVYYEILRPQLYPEYKQWKTLTDRQLAIVKAQQGATP